MPLLYHNNNSISNVTSFPQVPSGSLTLLSTATASASSSISFTSGIDSTYDIYQFEFINIDASNLTGFSFNLSTDNGSNYNVTKTTTMFNAWHDEEDTSTSLSYITSADLAQSTADQSLAFYNLATASDSGVSGTMQLFNPSSTTYVKHFIADINYMNSTYTIRQFTSGYGNTTSAINAIIFRMNTGNIDAGTIKMYGIKA
jgi:hypothetical protein